VKEKKSDEISSLKERIKNLECELEKFKDKYYCLCPALPTDLWNRSKNVWASALHSYLYGEPGDPGPLAIIERALFDAEKRGPSGRKDQNKVHCNGECNCSSKKVEKDDSKKTQKVSGKKRSTTKKKK